MLFCSEEYVNLDTDTRFAATGVYETRHETTGELFRACQKEFGRCVSAIRVSPSEMRVGWVFVQRRKYEDVNRTYLHETWVTIFDAPGKLHTMGR